MSERVQNLVYGVMAVLALAVIVVGLVQGDAAAPTDAERVQSLAASIKCPFCNGESLAESQSSVAAEYREIIAQRVADGVSDDAVIAEFAAKFGDSYILDTSTSRWSFALWLVPALAVVGGAAVVGWMYRAGRRRTRAGT